MILLDDHELALARRQLERIISREASYLVSPQASSVDYHCGSKSQTPIGTHLYMVDFYRDT